MAWIKTEVSVCQCYSIWCTVFWISSYSGQLLSNWNTDSGHRKSGIFSLPNVISTTWINYFTFLCFSLPLYIYLSCLLLNASVATLKISLPANNEIILLRWRCRSQTKDLGAISSHYLSTWVQFSLTTCLSQVTIFSLTTFIKETKELSILFQLRSETFKQITVFPPCV